MGVRVSCGCLDGLWVSGGLLACQLDWWWVGESAGYWVITRTVWTVMLKSRLPVLGCSF